MDSTLGKPMSPLLALPPEVRNCIYDAALGWPDLSNLAKAVLSQPGATIDQARSEQPLCTIPIPHCCRSTPSLLLLNRQITSEALEVLYRKALVLDSTPPFLQQLARPIDITQFISESTLQNLRFVVLKMDLDQRLSGAVSARGLLKTIEMLLDIWLVKNNLEQVHVQVQYTPREKDASPTFVEAVHHLYVRRLLSMARLPDVNMEIRGLIFGS
jgi:hypothetical protein